MCLVRYLLFYPLTSNRMLLGGPGNWDNHPISLTGETILLTDTYYRASDGGIFSGPSRVLIWIDVEFNFLRTRFNVGSFAIFDLMASAISIRRLFARILPLLASASFLWNYFCCFSAPKIIVKNSDSSRDCVLQWRFRFNIEHPFLWRAVRQWLLPPNALSWPGVGVSDFE